MGFFANLWTAKTSCEYIIDIPPLKLICELKHSVCTWQPNDSFGILFSAKINSILVSTDSSKSLCDSLALNTIQGSPTSRQLFLSVGAKQVVCSGLTEFLLQPNMFQEECFESRETEQRDPIKLCVA